MKNVFSYIGRSLYSSDAYLNARISEFRIYDQALSASDIALSFQLGTNTPANHGPAVIATQPQEGSAFDTWLQLNATRSVTLRSDFDLGDGLRLYSVVQVDIRRIGSTAIAGTGIFVLGVQS